MTYSILRLCFIVLLWAAARGASPLAAQTTPEAPPALPASGAADEAYLRAGDAMSIVIWREPDLSGQFAIDERGIVTLPLLGALEVGGQRFGGVRSRLRDLYAAQLQNPSISISYLKRIYILGDVRKPDLYGVDPTLSLAGAIALAGGTTEQGDLNKIRIIGADGIERRIQSEVSLTTADVRSGDQIFVGRSGWLARNSPVLIGTALSSLASILVTLLVVNR